MSQKINLKLGFRKSLFKRLGFLVVVFTVALISLLYYQFKYLFTEQDNIIAAHEMYYYSEMVSSWSNPPDTNLILLELNNLQMWCGIYEKGVSEDGISYPTKVYWSNLPSEISVKEFYTWSTSSDYEEFYGINIPMKVFFGTLYSVRLYLFIIFFNCT